MKAYQDEIERVAEIVTKRALKEFGFKYPKVARAKRSSNPSSSHEKALCEACRLSICTEEP